MLFRSSMPEKRQSPERTLSIYGKNVEQKDIQICFDFSSRTMSLSDSGSDRQIDHELAYIIEQTVARGISPEAARRCRRS